MSVNKLMPRWVTFLVNTINQLARKIWEIFNPDLIYAYNWLIKMNMEKKGKKKRTTTEFEMDWCLWLSWEGYR